MIICNFCSKRFKKLITLKKHIFSSHLLSRNGNCKLVCNIEGCQQQVNDKLGLRKHMQRKHKGKTWKLPKSWYKDLAVGAVVDDATQSCSSFEVNTGTGTNWPTGISSTCQNQATNSVDSCETSSSTGNNFITAGAYTNDIPINDSYMLENDDYDVVVYQNTLENLHLRKVVMAQSLCKLKSDYNLTETTLSAIQEWAEGIIEEGIRTIVGGVKAHFPAMTPQIKNVLQLGLGMANPFADVRTELQRKKAMPCLIPSKQYVLLQTPKDSSRKGYSCHTMEYIPLLDLLQMLLENSSLYQLMQEKKDFFVNNDDHVMESFDQGTYAKQHPLFNSKELSFQLLFYYDGFEVVNPLGSKTNKHHMGAIYFVILNIHSKWNSALDRIFLSSVFYTKDLKHPDIGWEKILKPLNEDLHQLESVGIRIVVSGEEITIKGSICQMSLDNLAAHSILGFTEAFSGSGVYSSRYCLCTGSDMQLKNSYKQCQLRTKELYDVDVSIAETTGRPYHGIKFRCPIKSKYFHAVENYSADIHHDVFEGVIPYVMKLTLQTLIFEKKYFTLETLNHKLNCFDYGSEKKNKPSPISRHKLMESSGKNLRQNASQYWCLLRVLPFLIGKSVPEDDDAWMFYLLFMEIVDLCCCPRLTPKLLIVLEMSLFSMINEFKRIHHRYKIIPKMHYLLLYPLLIKKVGPLSQFSCMRFEAKHKLMKRLVTQRNNYKNVPRTIAMNNQIKLAATASERDLFRSQIQTEGDSLCTTATVFENYLRCPTTSLTVKKVTSAVVDGVKYTHGCCLCVGVYDTDLPEFFLVDAIYVDEAECILIGTILNCIRYSEHFHAWLLDDGNKYPIAAYCKVSNLVYPHPLCVRQPYGSFDSYIAPKVHLESFSSCYFLSS